MNNLVFLLMVIMQFKHFIADYPLQGAYMLGKFKDKGWVAPLAAHCGVHFLFTTLIALFAGTSLGLALGLGALDFCIHFVMDRIKASPKMLGRFQALSKTEMINLLGEEKVANRQCFESDLGGRVNVALFTPAAQKLKEIDEKKKSNVLFWWSLGLDQMVHHLTDILVVYLIVSNL